jgi:hypothetical protein
MSGLVFLRSEQRLPAELAPRLLGRFVIAPQDPTKRIVPFYSDQTPYLDDDDWLGPIISQGDDFTSNTAQAKFLASLKDFASVGRDNETSHHLKLENCTVKVRRLASAGEAFDKMMAHENVATELEKMYDDDKHLFMITLVKSVSTGSGGKLIVIDSKKKESSIRAKLPVKEALLASPAAAVATMLPDIDPSLQSDNKHEYGSGETVTLEGEQIYAIQYLQILSKPIPKADAKTPIPKADTPTPRKTRRFVLGDNDLDGSWSCLGLFCWYRRRRAPAPYAGDSQYAEGEDAPYSELPEETQTAILGSIEQPKRSRLAEEQPAESQPAESQPADEIEPVDESHLHSRPGGTRRFMLVPNPDAVFDAVREASKGEGWSKDDATKGDHINITPSEWTPEME